MCYTGSMFTTVGDLQYVAGLYEGEGSCGSYTNPNRSKQYRQYSAKIDMKDLFPLEEVLRIIGFGKIYGPYRKKNSTTIYYTYQIAKFEYVQAFLVMIFPWLSPRRQEQVCDCLDKEYLYEYDYIA